MDTEDKAYGAFKPIYLALRLLEKLDPEPFRSDIFDCEVDDIFDRLSMCGFTLGKSVLMNEFNSFLNEVRRRNRRN